MSLRIFCHLPLFSLVSVVAVLLRQWFTSQFRLTWNSLHSLSWPSITILLPWVSQVSARLI